MRILVTGSEGYIGTVLVAMLMERGYDVTGLDTCYLAYRRFVPHAQAYRLIKKDVRDVDVADLEGFEAIIHLAALSNDPTGELQPVLTDAINHKASVRLAKLARSVGVKRFIFSSSCSIYGAGQTKCLDENAAFRPLTAYARSKVDTEADIHKLASPEFSPVYLRNGTAYGLSARMRFDLVLNNLTGWGYTTGKVTLLSDGTAWRPLVHIRDISLAMIACLEAPRELIHNQAFNVGVPNANYQIRTVSEEVVKVVVGSVVSFAQGGEADTRNYNVSFDKIHSVLGDYFKPTWGIKQGIEEIYHACQVAKLDYETFNGPEYVTIKGLKKLINENKLDDQLYWKESRYV